MYRLHYVYYGVKKKKKKKKERKKEAISKQKKSKDKLLVFQSVLMEFLNETTAPLFHRHSRKCPDRFWGKLRPKRQCRRLAFFLHLRLAPQSSSSLPLPSSALCYTDDGDDVKVTTVSRQTHRHSEGTRFLRCESV